MNCPKCGHGYSIVKDSRTTNNAKMRRRECCGCGHRFTCYEVSAEDCEKMTRACKQLLKAAKTLEGFENAEN